LVILGFNINKKRERREKMSKKDNNKASSKMERVKIEWLINLSNILFIPFIKKKLKIGLKF